MTGVPLNIRIELLRQYGSFPQAYSATFQLGLEHFGDERGFIAYKRVWDTTLVLSDPIAPRENQHDLIELFLKDHHDAAFWQVSRPMADILGQRGFYINELGPENRIDLVNYDFSGRDKHDIRNAFNRARRRGYRIRESSFDEIGVNEAKAVSDKWRRLQTVSNRELTFLARPLVIGQEPDVRALFVSESDGKLVAFSVFDPVYDKGHVVGYTCQHSRHRPDADLRVQHAIKGVAIEEFQKEGKKWLFLGLSPCADIHDHDFAPYRNRVVNGCFRFSYRSWLFNRLIFPFNSIAAHKRQFRGSAEQTYYCFNTLPSFPRILKVFRACNVL